MGLTTIDSSVLIPALAPWHSEHAHADRVLEGVTDLRGIHSSFEVVVQAGT